MSHYRVCKHFSWGGLRLEPEQLREITSLDERGSSVQVYGTSDAIQVSSKAVLAQVQLGNLRLE